LFTLFGRAVSSLVCNILCSQQLSNQHLRGAANTQQLLWRQNFCSRWTSLVKLSSGPAAQSRHHLYGYSDDSCRDTYSGSMNTAELCDFWYAAP